MHGHQPTPAQPQMCPNCGRWSYKPHPPVVCAAILEDAWINACRTVGNVEGAIVGLFGNLLAAGAEAGVAPKPIPELLAALREAPHQR